MVICRSFFSESYFCFKFVSSLAPGNNNLLKESKNALKLKVFFNIIVNSITINLLFTLCLYHDNSYCYFNKIYANLFLLVILMTIQRGDVNKFFNRKFNYEKNSEYGIEKI